MPPVWKTSIVLCTLQYHCGQKRLSVACNLQFPHSSAWAQPDCCCQQDTDVEVTPSSISWIEIINDNIKHNLVILTVKLNDFKGLLFPNTIMVSANKQQHPNCHHHISVEAEKQETDKNKNISAWLGSAT